MSACANTAYAEDYQRQLVTDDGQSDAVSRRADEIEADIVAEIKTVKGAMEFIEDFSGSYPDPYQSLVEIMAKLMSSPNPNGIVLRVVRSAAIERAIKEARHKL